MDLAHVGPGLVLLAFGIWHLFNNIKLFCLNPKTFSSSPWFPTPILRYLELYTYIVTSLLLAIPELFITPKKHHPLDIDGTIPSTHIRTFEHTSIALSFIVYAVFAIVFDRKRPKAGEKLTYLALAAAFGQEILILHFHSTDHIGMNGQFHLIYQLIIFVSLLTTLMGISMPKSFMLSFVRSSSLVLQGSWLIIIGFFLYSPSLIPKGCFFHMEKGYQLVKCSSEEALHRSKALVIIEFSWLLVLATIFVLTFYLVLDGVYGGKAEYLTLTTTEKLEEDEEMEPLKKVNVVLVAKNVSSF